MADPSRADQFEIQAVERSALPGEKIVVRIRGRWRGRERPQSEGILVVEQKGREYRFFANPAPRRARFARPGTWIGSFALPASLALDAEGQLSLHFGRITIPLPSTAGESRLAARAAAPGDRAAAADGDSAAADEELSPAAIAEEVDVQRPDPESDEAVTDEHPLLGDADEDPGGTPAPDAAEAVTGAGAAAHEGLESGEREVPAGGGSSAPAGPATEAATLAALRTELERRASSEASLRGRLADVEADLRARAAMLAKLEPTLQELREEQARLRDLIERRVAREAELESLSQRLEHELSSEREESARLRAALASDEVSRQAAVSEASALRSEVDRLASDLAAAREDLVAHDPNLAEAQSMLAEARELRARLVGNGRTEP